MGDTLIGYIIKEAVSVKALIRLLTVLSEIWKVAAILLKDISSS